MLYFTQQPVQIARNALPTHQCLQNLQWLDLTLVEFSGNGTDVKNMGFMYSKRILRGFGISSKLKCLTGTRTALETVKLGGAGLKPYMCTFIL